jgi:hypothetical protein
MRYPPADGHGFLHFQKRYIGRQTTRKKNERFKGLRGVKMQKAIATKKAQQAKTTVGKRDLKDSARKGVS